MKIHRNPLCLNVYTLIATSIACILCISCTQNTVSKTDSSELLRQLASSDADTRVNAYHTLVEAGPSVVPILLSKQWTEQWFVGPYRRMVLSQLGEGAVDPVAEIIEKKLSEPDADIEGNEIELSAAIQALGEIGPPASDKVNLLVQILQSNDQKVVAKMMACQALESIGVKSQEVTDVLVEVLKEDMNADLGGMLEQDAAFALGTLADSIDPDDLQFLIEKRNAVGTDTKIALSYALYQLSWEPDDMLQYIIRSSTDANGRQTAFKALSRICSERTIDVLNSISSDTEDPLRDLALSELGNCGPREDILQIIISHLEGDDLSTQMAAAVELMEFGQDARDALPALEALLGELSSIRNPTPSEEEMLSIVQEDILLISSAG